ncbi:sodium/hydrogen exchanger 9-like isoform X3 [Haliotis rufescens]|uniref:sodium/hydrogen exchanger 9-like isoform X3 n=1 Tax=Haliotis rufescens TaxID=6454 RepID=UPI001EB0065D|nr:sodium/hydrogen exchanger 9-like isoform X3 [Haliotis rufescens]
MAAGGVIAVFVTACCCISSAMAAQSATISPAASNIQKEKTVALQHTTDSLTILMLLGLLMLTILTVWLFKHRRFRFVHETGLSMIYGLIVGVIIKFIYATPTPPVTPDDSKVWAVLSESNNQTFYSGNAPPSLYISLPDSKNATANETFKYNLTSDGSAKPEPMLEKAVTFEPELFFNVMLPLIIFEAGYSMKRRHFFKNLGAIIMFAFIGTTISCLAVGGTMFGLTRLMSYTEFTLNDCFFFGAIISATDPVTVLALFHDLHVDVDLYAIVFGESVFNDAVAIVLSGSVETYGQLSGGKKFNAEAFFKALGNFLGIFGGAFAIGSLMGCATALITKYTKIRDFPLLETALFFLMSYSSFQTAEVAGLTGIVAVLFCGITQAHYTYNNLSAESKDRTKQLFELTNFLSENFVFLYIGVSVFTFQESRIRWDAGFIFASFLAIIIGRFLNVYPLSFLLNLGRTNKIGWNFQHMMMFSGLRGAIAFALAIRNTSTLPRQYIVSATMIIVLATVVLCGGLTTPMLQWLKIRVGVDEELEMQQMPPNAVRSFEAEEGQSLAGSPLLEQESGDPGEIPRTKGKAWLVAKWYNFDMVFMKPFLTNCRPTLMETLPKCCLPLAKLLTTEEQMTQGESHRDNDSDTDMIIDHSQLSIGESELSSIPSNHAENDTSRKLPIQEPETYDLGLGHNSQPMNLRVNLPGPAGDKV